MSNRHLGREAWPWVALVAVLLSVDPAAAGDAVDDFVAAARNAGCSPPPGPCGEGRLGRLPGARLIGGLFARGPHSPHACVAAVARCLQERGPAARSAVPALVRVLAEGPNDYDTGDGIIAARSEVAAALGAIGDPSAIDPLAGALRDARPAEAGPGARTSEEPAARVALLDALGRFGPAAAGARGLVATVLRERNADVGEVDRLRQTFDRMLSARRAADAERARRPGETHVAVSEAAVAAAVRGLDRRDPEYVREFETFSEDRVASACADALAAMGAADTVAVLVATLRRPPAAASAARAIARLAPARSGKLERSLIDVLEDPGFGPRARAAACGALGALSASAPAPTTDPDDPDRVVAALARALDDPAVSAAAAEALAALGPAARGALPRLVRLVMAPAGAERTETGALRYDANATARLGARRAAVRAIAAIDPREAAVRLGGLVRDEEIGPVVRRAIAGR